MNTTTNVNIGFFEKMTYQQYIDFNSKIKIYEIYEYGSFEVAKGLEEIEWNKRKEKILDIIEKEILSQKGQGQQFLSPLVKQSSDNEKINFSDNSYHTFHGWVDSYHGSFAFVFNGKKFIVEGQGHGGDAWHAIKGKLKVRVA